MDDPKKKTVDWAEGAVVIINQGSDDRPPSCDECEFSREVLRGPMECIHLHAGEAFDLVTGEVTGVPCFVERGDNGGCGPEGNRFRVKASILRERQKLQEMFEQRHEKKRRRVQWWPWG